jgi:xanthosine utilization system XapX-like protein
MLLAPLAAVLFGNGLTAGFVYCLWRLRRDERDLPALLGVIALLLVTALVALSLPR